MPKSKCTYISIGSILVKNKSPFCFESNSNEHYTQRDLFKNNKIKIDDKYQWLPSEFEIKDGKTKINSYINNLDTENTEMYDSISKVFDCFVPSFEETIGQKLDKFQVIVKISNIKLTPEKPVYCGGVWHLEGMPYENIIATGIYYYKINNISSSHLEFRREMEYPTDYMQNEHTEAEIRYGLKDEEFTNQYIGKINTCVEGKCIVFPNYIQHRVTDFELTNKNKSGTRNILVFFLIDPSKKIISTSDIPKQQNIMKLEVAKKYREELMFARKYVIDLQNEVYERKVSLCEH